jgi:membrane protease YdiL (CAAX protease family)
MQPSALPTPPNPSRGPGTFELPGQPPRVIVRVILFALIEVVTMMVLGPLLKPWAGSLVAGAVVSFGAAALANAITLRIYERGRLSDIGLTVDDGGMRNLGLGFLGGLGAALFVMVPPLLLGMAKLVPAPEQPRNWYSLLFVSVVLLLGAVGEEMLFRGYGFQLLLKRWGAFATILPMAVLFSNAHSGNPDITWIGYANTFLWGVLFGVCFLRTGDLWLSTGMHFGWNWTLPLFGVNLSGFTMSVTGYRMEWTAGQLWSGGGYGVEGSILTLIVIPIVAFYIWKAPFSVQRPYLLREEE